MEWALKEFNQTAFWVKELINNLASAEFTRDLHLIETLFKPIWTDIKVDPDFSAFDEIDKAYLYRYAGSFLSNYGRSKALRDFQERGKDLLSMGANLFSCYDLIDEYYETQIVLANAYFYQGGGEEFDSILEMVEAFYDDNKEHQNYLWLQVNRMAWLKDSDITLAVNTLFSIKASVIRTPNLKIKIQYHNLAGIIYRLQNNYEESLCHFEKAIIYAKELNHKRHLANTLNCLGNLYRSWKKFELAHLKVDEAIRIGEDLGDVGWLAHYLDTKANIYYDNADFEAAEDTIHKSIMFFLQGEDYSGLCDALWLQVKILYQFEEREDAKKKFLGLINISLRNLSEKRAISYIEQYIDLTHFQSGHGYKEQVQNYKRFVLEVALRKSNGVYSDAAKNLLLLPGTLSEILTSQFPELKEIKREYSMSKTQRRSKSAVMKSQGITSYLLTKTVLLPTQSGDKLWYFHVPSNIAEIFFGKTEERIIAVAAVENFFLADLVFYRFDDSLRIGEIRENGDLYIFDFQSGKKLYLSDVKLFGRIYGQCPVSLIDKDPIRFYEFQIEIVD